MYHLRCAALFPDCPAELHLGSEEEILQAAAAHAAADHGVQDLDDATVAAVRAAITRD